jgi:RNA polymerase sigma-70 factor (ECF subfamily)
MNMLNNTTIHLSEEHLKHTLYKSIRNACINELKKNALHSEVIENIMIEESEEYDSNLFHAIVRVEIYREIIEAINKLPTKCGEIFKLAYLDQLDNGEINIYGLFINAGAGLILENSEINALNIE